MCVNPSDQVVNVTVLTMMQKNFTSTDLSSFHLTDSCVFTDPPDPNLNLKVSRAEIVRLNTTVYKLTRDLEVLHQLAEELMPDQRAYQALYTANQMVNSIIAGDDR